MSLFSKVLDQAIRESGKTLKEISAECKRRGVSIDTTSLSKMRTGDQGPPPPRTVDEPVEKNKTRVLAEVLGGDPSEWELIAALEVTPAVVIGGIYNLRYAVTELGRTAALTWNISERMLRTFKEVDAESLPIDKLSGQPLPVQISDLQSQLNDMTTASALLGRMIDPYLMRIENLRDDAEFVYGDFVSELTSEDAFLTLTTGLARMAGIDSEALRAFIWALHATQNSESIPFALLQSTGWNIKRWAELTFKKPHNTILSEHWGDSGRDGTKERKG